MLRTPPDVLITTPESLYLMLTSRAREFLVDAEAVIVDEIHAVARTKRGAHLALTPRAARAPGRTAAPAHRPVGHAAPARGGRPLPRRARAASARIVDAGIRKPLDLKIHVPVESMREPDAHDVTDPAVGGMGTAAGGGDLVGDGLGGGAPAATARSIWPAIYPELLELVQAAPLHDHLREQPPRRRAARRAAERAGRAGGAEQNGAGRTATAQPRPTIARAHHGSLAREERLVVEDLLKSGELPCLVATSLARARHRHGRRGPRDPGRVAQVGDRRAPAHRPRRPRRRRGLARAHLPEVPRRPARVRRGGQAHARRRHRADGRARATRSTCSPSRSWP